MLLTVGGPHAMIIFCRVYSDSSLLAVSACGHMMISFLVLLMWPHEVKPWFHYWYRGSRVETPIDMIMPTSLISTKKHISLDIIS